MSDYAAASQRIGKLPSDKPARRLTDILENIDRIQSYTKDYSLERFAQDRQCRDAVERCLSRISEAAKKLEGLVESLAPDQPWSDIRDIGNLLRHEYDRLDLGMIWDIVTNDITPLRQSVDAALKALQRDKPNGV
jgi:uncharacterized protein with HEPN domain